MSYSLTVADWKLWQARKITMILRQFGNDTETIAGDGLPGVLKVDPDKIPVDTNLQQAVRTGKIDTDELAPKKIVRTNNIESPPIKSLRNSSMSPSTRWLSRSQRRPGRTNNASASVCRIV